MTWDDCLALGATRLAAILGCPVTTAHSWIRRSGPPDWQKAIYLAVIIAAQNAGFAVALPDTRGRHCYLTEGEGDPPRTYTPEHANRYPTRLAAAAAIIEARKLTPLRPRVMIVVPHPANDTAHSQKGRERDPDNTQD